MLRLYNSLSKKVEVCHFQKQKPIRWYCCGPTIYDSAHLGHARTYLTFDIIKRVLEHLGYTVNYVMNITDIDDKIINKVRELNTDITSNESQIDPDIYNNFVKCMEQEFWQDMDALNVQRPENVLRVTDFIDKICGYIQTIMVNGYAYVSKGSVYFDSQKFIADGYDFAPFGIDCSNQVKDDKHLEEKNHHQDFVLWKKSRDSEVSFDSPWGFGRPGWHIECSAMATFVFGMEQFEIHSGGIDLEFPHHNNELIQAIAFIKPTPGNASQFSGHSSSFNKFNLFQKSNTKKCLDVKWAEFFIHTGHLNISGLKMSKSLKNFITIREFLTNIGTAQELRLMFLMHKWNRTIDFSRDSVEQARNINNRFKDFIKHVDFVQKEKRKLEDNMYLQSLDEQYLDFFINLKLDIRKALLDNIDTQTVMHLLLESVNNTYSYMMNSSTLSLVTKFTKFLTDTLEMFGLSYSLKSELCRDDSDHFTSNDQFIELSVNLRDDMRTLLKKYKAELPKNYKKELFQLLDNFRDVELRNVGVSLEDDTTTVGKSHSKWTRIN